MDDPKLRMKCVRKLSEAGFKLNKNAFREDAIYSRFFRTSQIVSNISEEDSVRDAVLHLLQSAKEKFILAEKVFQEVFTKKSG